LKIIARSYIGRNFLQLITSSVLAEAKSQKVRPVDGRGEQEGSIIVHISYQGDDAHGKTKDETQIAVRCGQREFSVLIHPRTTVKRRKQKSETKQLANFWTQILVKIDVMARATEAPEFAKNGMRRKEHYSFTVILLQSGITASRYWAPILPILPAK